MKVGFSQFQSDTCLWIQMQLYTVRRPRRVHLYNQLHYKTCLYREEIYLTTPAVVLGFMFVVKI